MYDIRDPSSPVRLLNAGSESSAGAESRGDRTSGSDAAYTVVFEDHAGAEARYLALTPAAYHPPAGIVADEPSDLRDAANGADEIIITHDGFYADILPLAAHREAQGLRVEVVRVTDVYDEFSGGVFTPQAIRDFLAYAYSHWTAPAPSYVLLVGDANFDYLDRFGTGSLNYMPTYVFDAMDVGETANDTWLACVDGGDPLPDLFLGRFSARSRADVQAMVNKAIGYEANPTLGAWSSRALYVADDDLPFFETMSENWIAQPSKSMTAVYMPCRRAASTRARRRSK